MSKNEIEINKLHEIITNINNKSRTLSSYEKELNINRSSIKRRIQGLGYRYNKGANKWIKSEIPYKISNKKINPSNASVSNNTLKEEDDAKLHNANNTKQGRLKRKGEYKRFNAELPADLLKALKRKALEEDKTSTEIIIKLLIDNIEEKYKKS